MDDWMPVGQMPAQPQQPNDWAPVGQQPQQRGVIDQLFGIDGPRYQTWPERLVRGVISGAEMPAQYMEESTQPKSSISDSDVSVLSVPSAMNLATIANPVTPAMRAGGGILGGPLRQAPIPPTEAQLKQAATALYQDPAVTGLRLAPQVGPNLVNQVEQTLLQNKLDPVNAPNVLKTIGNIGTARFEQPTTQAQTVLSGPGYHIANDVTSPAPLQVSDFDLARSSLYDVPQEQGRAARLARGVIDQYLGNIPPSDVVAGDAAAANSKLLDARANTAALKRSQEVTAALTRAENQAGSTYSGQNLDNATRQQLRPILNDKMGVSKSPAFQDYTPQEIDAIRSAANGTPLRNTVRSIGKLAGSGHGIGAGVVALQAANTAHEAGLPWMAAAGVGGAVGAGGWALNRLGNSLTQSEANRVGELLRMRSPLASQNMAPVYPALQPAARTAPYFSFNLAPSDQLAAALASWRQNQNQNQ